MMILSSFCGGRMLVVVVLMLCRWCSNQVLQRGGPVVEAKRGGEYQPPPIRRRDAASAAATITMDDDDAAQQQRRRKQQQQQQHVQNYLEAGGGDPIELNPDYERYVSAGGPRAAPSSRRRSSHKRTQKPSTMMTMMTTTAAPGREQDGDILQWRQQQEQLEHQLWLRQQQQQQQQIETQDMEQMGREHTSQRRGNHRGRRGAIDIAGAGGNGGSAATTSTWQTPTGFGFGGLLNTPSSRFQCFINNLADLVQTSPTLFWTTAACLFFFVLWQSPSAHTQALLLRFVLCSRSSVFHSGGLSLVLAAVSHKSIRHLILNLVCLWYLAPPLQKRMLEVAVQRQPRRQRQRNDQGFFSRSHQRQKSQQRDLVSYLSTSLWPLLLGSAIFSNALFVTIRPAGSVLGLNGIIMALMSAWATSLPPATQIRTYLMGIVPVKLPVHQTVMALAAINVLGSLSRDSTLPYTLHLGGLVFGWVYGQVVFHPERRVQFVLPVRWRGVGKGFWKL